jgi:hypothetical protein
VSEFDRRGFKEFLAGLGDKLKDDESIQEILQFYCLHGVKENEFASILALFLQRYSRGHDEKFTAVVNSSLPKHYGKLVESLQNKSTNSYFLSTNDFSNASIIKKVVGVGKKGKLGRNPVSDIQVFNFSSDLRHVIELKSDRRQKYLSELLKYKKTKKFPKKGCIEALTIDLKTLASLQAFSVYEGVVFWQGILTYSFYQIGSTFPVNFPKYGVTEAKDNKNKRKISMIRGDIDEKSWFESSSEESFDLEKELKVFLSEQKFLVPPEEIYRIQVAQGIVNLYGELESSEARVLVQSELLIFEVQAKEIYLSQIAPQIINKYAKAIQQGNKRNR